MNKCGHSIAPAGLLVLILLLPALLAAGAHPARAGMKAVQLDAGSGEYDLGPYLQVLEDPSRALGIREVSSAALAKRFRQNHSASLNLGLSDSVFWLRFRVELPKDAQKGQFVPPWFFYMGRSLDYYEEIKIFWPTAANAQGMGQEQWQSRTFGRYQAFATGKRQPLAANIPLPTGERRAMTYYVRVDMQDTLFMTPALFSPQGFAGFSRRESLFYGIYYGALLAMLIYNLFLFVSLREKVRLLFIIYTTIIGFYFLIVNEISLNFMPVDFFNISREVAIMLAMISVAGIVIFVQEFLEAKRHLPKINLALQLLKIFTILTAIAVIFVPFVIVHRIATTLGIAGSVIVTWAGIASLVSGYRPARFFMIAWPFFTAGGIIFSLTFAGVFPFTSIGLHAFQIGSGIEVVLLSFAIADRMRILKEQLDQEQARRQTQLKRFTRELERSEEKERRRIAGILHDSLGQKLYAVKWEMEHLAGAKAGIFEGYQALEHLDGCIDEARDLTAKLYPRELYDLGLEAALHKLASDFGKRFGLRVTCRLRDDPQGLSDELMIALYRSVAELLNNVVKHAEANRAELGMEIKDDRLIITLADNGKGFERLPAEGAETAGFGLFSIRERVRAAGGGMSVENLESGGGGKITLAIPAG